MYSPRLAIVVLLLHANSDTVNISLTYYESLVNIRKMISHDIKIGNTWRSFLLVSNSLISNFVELLAS